MAANVKYDQIPNLLFAATIQWPSDNIYAMLVSSSYTPDVSVHTQKTDVVAYEITGTGYTAGGVLLTNPTVTNTKLDIDDPSWTTLTATFRYIVVYANVTRDGLTDPLIWYTLPDETPADTVIVAANYAPQWPTNGIFTYSST